MLAVIMGGGEGSRLRPLTASTPKPLVPVAGKPALMRIFTLLRTHDIKRAAVTLRYLGDMIKESCSDKCEGIALEYFTEENALGTAGGVKNTESFLRTDEDDSFLIISGDAVAELDLTAAIAFHRKENADVTLILSYAEDAGEYGVVVCENGRVKRFIEKPAPSQQFSHTVNTGIYIMKKSLLALIPEGEFRDFGRDLFPALLERGARLCGYADRGYWCDIGDISALYSCTLRLAALEGTLKNGGYISDGVSIGEGAKINGSIIFSGVKIGAGAVIRSSIIAENARIGEGAVIKRGSVVGAESLVGRNAVINENVRLPDGSMIERGENVSEDTAFCGGASTNFREGGIFVPRERMTASYAMKIGAAMASAAGQKHTARVGVISGEGASLYSEASLCGIADRGADTYDLISDGFGFEAMGAFAAREYRLDGVAVIAEHEDGIKFSLYDQNGLYPTRAFERAAAAAMITGGKIGESGRIIRGHELAGRYRDSLTDMCGELAGMSFTINENCAARLCADILKERGAKLDEKAALRFYINSAGTLFTVYYGGLRFDMWHTLALTAAKIGSRLALPFRAPEELTRLLAKSGVEALRYCECPCDGSEDEIRALAGEQLFTRDALAQCITLSSMLAESGKAPDELYSALPKFAVLRESCAAPCPDISESAEQLREGAVFDFRIGRVRIFPGRGEYTLVSEAVSVEAAEEIMSLTRKKLASEESLAENQEKS